MKVLNRTDVAVIVCDYNGIDDYEKSLIQKLNELDIPFIILVNKTDIQAVNDEILTELKNLSEHVILTSTVSDGQLVYKFKETLVKLLPDSFVNSPQIAGDLVPEKVL